MGNVMLAMSREERNGQESNSGMFVIVIENPNRLIGKNKAVAPPKKKFSVVGPFGSRDEAWDWGNDKINNRCSWKIVDVQSTDQAGDLDFLK